MTDGQADALDLHLTTLLERDDLDPTKRLAVEALLRRRDDDGVDNPPLSILFERYYSEHKLPAKTKLEWARVMKRFTTAVGADLPVRAITAGHVRNFKTALFATTGRTGKTLSAPR
jgi:hypothetical protein